MKCPQGLWVQTLITAVFQPTYMLTSTNMNASIFWKEIVQFSQRMILMKVTSYFTREKKVPASQP